MVINQLNEYVIEGEKAIKVYMEDGKYTAEVLYESDENRENASGSETFNLHDTPDGLAEEMKEHNVVFNF